MMNAEPLVSVCMTAYNHAPYIGRAIEGVLSQRTTFAVELVLSDDCSPDGTGAICRDYAARYPDRIRLLTGDVNVGMRANYRRTIEACRGRYVAMCDGDDWWCDPLKLQRQVEALEADPACGLSYTRSERRFEATGERRRYPAGELFCDFDRLLFDNTVENCTAVARRELILRYYAEVRPEEHPEWLTDDAPMWIWFAACSRIRASEEVTAVHRMLPESGSQSRASAIRCATSRSGSTPVTARGATCGRCVGVGCAWHCGCCRATVRRRSIFRAGGATCGARRCSCSMRRDTDCW